MNDADLDHMLREHGTQWQAHHQDVAAVDWQSVTPAHRPRFIPVAVAAAVTVLAVLVPVVLLNRHEQGATPSQPTPSPSASQQARPVPREPRYFLAIDGSGKVTQVDALRGESTGLAVSEAAHKPTALGAADGSTGYAAFPAAGCHVNLMRYVWSKPTSATGSDVATIPGRSVDEIAVSPNGRRLALSVRRCEPRSDAYDLVVVDVATGSSRSWHGYQDHGRPDISFVRSLHWDPGSRYLATVAVPCCGGGYDGARIVDTRAGGSSYVSQPVVLPEYADHLGTYGPLFWWHDHLAVVVDGTVRAVRIGPATGSGATRHVGELGAVLAQGFPHDTVDFSADPTGEHFLISDGDHIQRWDAGALTPIPGRWRFAGW